jgi:hypothetical protein
MLLLLDVPRYNQDALRLRLHSGFWHFIVLVLCAVWAASCAAPLGPGYTVEKQEIHVQFAPPAHTIHVDADYQLRNTGDRPICEIEILLPLGRRLHRGPVTTTWDGQDIATEPTPDRERNSTIHFASPWPVSATHALRIAYDILPAELGGNGLSFASDGFYLPAAGWSPELPQVRGLFGFGGVPPKKWELVVNVPDGFLVHASGIRKKAAHEAHGAQTLRALQTVDDRYPFVVAGKYVATETRAGQQKIILWSRTPRDAEVLRQASTELAHTIDLYNSIFGVPASRSPAFYIVECPAPTGCISRLRSTGATLLGAQAAEEPSAELASSDTVMVDSSEGAPKLAAAAAPSLAASWLGYGRNPGFYEQTPPLSLLPIFAAARSREEIEGPQVRGDTIRRALRLIPKNPASPPSATVSRQTRAADQPADVPAERAKSFLFFYALQDRYGREASTNAITHMLHARAGRGFDLDDLIAAYEQETHENVAQFVRTWMKHPGVPDDFRLRYESGAAAAAPGAAPDPSRTVQSAFPSKGDTP